MLSNKHNSTGKLFRYLVLVTWKVFPLTLGSKASGQLSYLSHLNIQNGYFNLDLYQNCHG